MKGHRYVLVAAFAAAAALLFAACGGDDSSAKDPLEVVKQYYAAQNAQDVDKALSYVADDAVAAPADGTVYKGKDEIRGLLESGASSNFVIELSNFRVQGGRVVYDYKITSNGNPVDSGTNGLTIVKDGKVVFDGTEGTEP